MKRLLGKKAFTLIEVLLSIAIFAIIALPLFNVFVQSVKTDTISRSVLNANYISQEYIETLDSKTYAEALSEIPYKQQVGDYYLSTQIKPYGTQNSLLSGECGYAQLIIFSEDEGGGMLAVMPDGKWRTFETVPSSISFNISSGYYSFSSGCVSISGACTNGRCAMVINASRLPLDTTAEISAGAGCAVTLYCNKDCSENIVISGACASEVYEVVADLNSSMAYVKCSVYETQQSADPIAISESYLNLRNW